MSNISPQENPAWMAPVSTKKDAKQGNGTGQTQPPLSKVKKMLKTIRPVDRDFGIMVGALSRDQIEQVASELHEKNNRQTLAIMKMLDEVEVYLVDPERFGSKTVIGKLHDILLEATQ